MQYFCVKILTSGFVQVSEFFFSSIVALHDVNEGGTSYICVSPGRTRPCTFWLQQEHAYQRASFGSTARNLSRVLNLLTLTWIYINYLKTQNLFIIKFNTVGKSITEKIKCCTKIVFLSLFLLLFNIYITIGKSVPERKKKCRLYKNSLLAIFISLVKMCLTFFLLK